MSSPQHDDAVRAPGPGAGASEDLRSALRVDHAGEYGATRIYLGQLAVMRRGPKKALLEHMLAQEQHHLATFEALLGEHRTRPTALLPLWRSLGFALGAATALLGERAAMACTVAVEETIDAHYAGQADQLGADHPRLRETIERFRQEELEHRDIALENDAERAPAYGLLSQVIRSGCKVAIELSKHL